MTTPSFSRLEVVHILSSSLALDPRLANLPPFFPREPAGKNESPSVATTAHPPEREDLSVGCGRPARFFQLPFSSDLGTLRKEGRGRRVFFLLRW